MVNAIAYTYELWEVAKHGGSVESPEAIAEYDSSFLSA